MNIFSDILNDIRVELADEFDQNFERKAFFDDPWPSVRMKNKRGSLMLRTGRLRRSMRARVTGTSIVFTSSTPYAQLHNEGGKVKVTAKMRRFFWAMYYKNTNAITHSIKTKSAANTSRNKALTEEAAWWKALALKQVGETLNFPKRQFIGNHREVKNTIERVLKTKEADIDAFIKSKLKVR